MKKFKFSSRVLAFVLAFVMIASLFPLSALAAVGDIYTGTDKSSGIKESTLNQDDTINWPIKVYDYLSDGMLFEFAQSSFSSTTGTTAYANTSSKGDPETNLYGGQYVLGQPMPYAKYGHDFTTDIVYNQKVNTGYTSSENRTYKKTRVSAVDYTSPQYMRIGWSGATNSSYLNCCITDFVSDHGATAKRNDVRYMALVYRASGLSNTGYTATNYINFNVECGDGNWRRPIDTIKDINGNYVRNTSGWTAVVIDLYQNCSSDNWSGYYSYGLNRVFVRLGLNSTSDYFDIAQVGYFSTAEAAKTYGDQCLKFISEPGEYISGYNGLYWNEGNNTAFGFLFPSNSKNWPTGGGTASYGNASAGYYTHQIGYRIPEYKSGADTYNQYRKTGKDSDGRFNGTGNLQGENGIYYIDAQGGGYGYQYSDNYQEEHPNATTFDMSELDFGGYNLLTEGMGGLWTAGLLQSTLGKDGTPQYKQETVEYLADLLSKTLTIPQYAASNSAAGYPNYNYVAGVKNAEQYGTTAGKANDLAQGLRNCLGITFTQGNTKGSTPKMGSYADTLAKADNLKGAFLTVANGGYISTCMDAAYYLLHNLFVDNSYNELQDDFTYLTLSSAELSSGGTAYVFDGGFSQGASLQDLRDGKITQEEYKANSKNAVEYSGYNASGDGTISHKKVDGKDYYYYQGSSTTTRYPFLPVVEPEGEAYKGQTDSYYFAEDDKRKFDTEFGTYYGRNYGYTLVSNGEFVYQENDDLFFEFEGDDDVYLFLNGELVLDLGGGHSISSCRFNVNDYVQWSKTVLANPTGYSDAEVARAKALNLEDGEIASFDFYYMERHGVGANCRIVTNMHITDPALRVQKQAFQGGKEIDYGGIVDGATPIAYKFVATNGGNQKLYNLTFDDADIGVSLTPENGLQVSTDENGNVINGFIVTDARLGELEPQDLIAVVKGFKDVGTGGDYVYDYATDEYNKVEAGTGRYEYVVTDNITFADNEALKRFLTTLESNATDNSTVDDEQTRRGSGLWVDATLEISGIYYKMTNEQREAGSFNNTVYVTATTKVDREDPGCVTKRSDDSHRVYITAIPSYYQWKDNELFITEQRILDDATSEAGNENSLLNEYKTFFDIVNKDTNKIRTGFCDKYGTLLDYDTAYEFVKDAKDASGAFGFKTNYNTTGIHEFYLLMYLDGKSGKVETMEEGDYAIVRVLIIVADTEDATYVLDYGLKTENLDVNGELFKNDELLGTLSGTQAKLMGVSSTEGEYLKVSDGTSDYNRVDFAKEDLSDSNDIYVNGKDGKADGFYTFNMAVPDTGKEITYNKFSGLYSLTDSGTTLVHTDVPYTWEDLYLYYWYDDGRDNTWPGEKMNKLSHGSFELAIPGNVPHIIISNGTKQSIDIDITPGQEVWVEITGELNSEDKLIASPSYKTSDGIIHAKVPEGWGEVYLYCWDAFGNGIEVWPGTKIEEADADGFFTHTIPGDITNVIINNGDNGKQTSDLVVYAGQETWITVSNTPAGHSDDLNIDYYNAVSSRSTENVTLHATVPSDWEGAAVYYWNSNGSYAGLEWPGTALTKGDDGVYTAEIPADISNVIINDGKQGTSTQTVDLTITPGLETWITVNKLINNTSVFATVPSNWESAYFYFFNDSGDVGPAWPGTAAEDLGDNEYYLSVPNGATKVIINNNNGNQTPDLLLVPNKTNQYVVEESGNTTSIKDATLKITVPDTWGEVYVHHWSDSAGGTGWPGEAATKNEDGTYSFTLPKSHNKFIINNNNNGKQTGDISLFYLGGENIVTVYDDGGYTIGSYETMQTKHTANIVYGENAEKEGFTFTPTDFMDSVYDLWLAITVHETDINTSQKPTPLGQAINIGKEVQMLKKVSVLPASVVYYEDTFAGITYKDDTANVITHYGQGTGSLTQSIDQNQQYGNDKTYQGSENDEMTGGSLTDVYINDRNTFATFDFTGTGFELIGHTHAVESGTLVATILDENGKQVKRVIVITEFDNGADGGTESIVSVPLIRVNGLDFGKYTVNLSGVPMYDYSNWTDKSKDPPTKTSYLCIDGVRIYQPLSGSAQITERKNLALGKTYTDAVVAEAGSLNGYYYTANLTDGVATDYIDPSFATGREGWFGYHRSLNSKTAADGSPYGQFTLDLEGEYSLDEFRLHVGNKDLGAPSYIDVYVSTDGKDWKHVGSPSNINYNPTDPYWAELKLDEAVEGRYVRMCFGFLTEDNWWVMANEVEVYGSKTISGDGVNDAYIDTENGATFSEIRNLIADRQAFAVKYDDTDGLSVSGGTSTWIENRNNVVPGDHNTRWTNNTVNSVNDYLLAGPNNEVYMIESTDSEKTALVFYVTETDKEVANLQVAVKAMDYASYIGKANVGKLMAQIEYGAYNADTDEYVWRPLTTITSSAEQYFTIPYTECPYDEVNNRYQVALRVANTDPTGMASYTSLKYNGLELLTLNETEVPDVIYGEELGNTILDSNGNTLDSSKFVGFIEIVDQMTGVTEPEQGGTGSGTDTTTPAEPVITGTDTSAMKPLYDTFTANTAVDFAIKDTSKIYVVTGSESNAPAQDVLDTAQLVQRQFAADGYDMDVVWGLAKYAEAGDILVYVNEDYFAGTANYDEAYKLEISSTDLGAGAITTAKLYTRNSDGMLYGLNTLQKHFRAAGTNAIKGFTIIDAPDTKERALHLDVARKYMSVEGVKNYIAQLSWMGYNAIELHMSEDGGMRMDFWGDKALAEVPEMTGNDFSWVCGDNPPSWVWSDFREVNGKYLTTEEIIEICETAKMYHIDIIPSFDTPAHVDYMTQLYYNTVSSNSNSSIRNFTYGGKNYTLPANISYRSTSWSVLNLGDTAVKNFAYAMYNDIAAFFAYYAGSTHFNIGADEVVLESTDPWTYTDFINYVNDVNDILKDHGYRTRMYNDFVYKNYTSSVALDSDIDIVYWLPYETTSQKYLKTASQIASDGRQIYSGVNFWTYYVLRVANTGSGVNGHQDARDPANTNWWFYRNQEDYIYNEWSPSKTGAYTDTNMGAANDYSGDKLAGGYFMIWNDFAGLNSEVEVWNGCYDEYGTYNKSTGAHSGNGNYYSMMERMWSNAIKQWNSDINSTLTFANYEPLRDKQGHFPGYVKASDSQVYMNDINLPAEEKIEAAYRTYHTVTFKNYDGTVIGTASVKEGFAATYVGTPTRPADVYNTYTFSGWSADISNITEDITVVAQYTSTPTVAGTTGYLELKSSGGSDIEMSVDNGTSRSVGTKYMNSSMDFGQLVTVKAKTNNDNSFIGWVNAKTGEVVSTDSTYSFYTSGNDVLVAMYAVDSAGESLVTFKNDKTNQIIEVQYYSPDEIYEIEIPKVVDYPGYTFAGWDLSEAEIVAKINAGENFTVTTKWTQKNVYFKVVVNNGSVQSSGGGGVDDIYTAYKATIVKADSAPAGQKFAYWQDEQERIVSYKAEYKFYPHKNTELTAVYVAESQAIDYNIVSTVDIDANTLGDANTVFFSWDATNSGCEIINTGVLLVEKKHYYSDTFGVGTIDENVFQYVPAINQSKSKTGSYSVTIPSVQNNETWYAKSFVQYRDANGIVRVAYSELAEATKTVTAQ